MEARATKPEGLSRYLTPVRIRRYPQLVALVCLAALLFDWFTGSGIVGGMGLLLGGDFLTFYTAGTAVATGHSAWLSDPAAQVAFQHRIAGHAFQSLSYWLNPPYFAWVFAPVSFLSYKLALAAFLLAGVGLAAVSFRALSRELRAFSTAGLLLGAMQFFPTIEWLSDGQTTPFWLSLYVAVFVSLRRGRDVLAGVALGCFACKPQLALGLGVALLAARRFKALASAGATACAWLLLGVATLPDEMRRYAHRGEELVAFIRSPDYLSHGLVGSLEVPTLLIGGLFPRVANAFGLVLTLSLLGIIARAWAQAEWAPGESAWDLRMAATFAFGVAASPHLYNYDLMLLVVPLFIAAARLPSNREGERPFGGGPLLTATAAVWALGLIGPLISKLEQELTRASLGHPAALQLGFFAVVLWGALVLRASEQSHAATSAESQPASAVS